MLTHSNIQPVYAGLTTIICKQAWVFRHSDRLNIECALCNRSQIQSPDSITLPASSGGGRPGISNSLNRRDRWKCENHENEGRNNCCSNRRRCLLFYVLLRCFDFVTKKRCAVTIMQLFIWNDWVHNCFGWIAGVSTTVRQIADDWTEKWKKSICDCRNQYTLARKKKKGSDWQAI